MREGDLSTEDYLALGEFRFQIRRFLHFSEEAAKAEDLEPQQHQLMLAVRACGEPLGPTVGLLAEQLFIRHHSAVGLVDRLEARRLVDRVRGKEDRRQVHVCLTAEGDAMLRRLSGAHREELRDTGPVLAVAIAKLLKRKDKDDGRV